MLVIAVAAAIVMVSMGASRWLRMLLFIPFWLSMLGFFQARAKT